MPRGEREANLLGKVVRKGRLLPMPVVVAPFSGEDEACAQQQTLATNRQLRIRRIDKVLPHGSIPNCMHFPSSHSFSITSWPTFRSSCPQVFRNSSFSWSRAFRRSNRSEAFFSRLLFQAVTCVGCNPFSVAISTPFCPSTGNARPRSGGLFALANNPG